jgi:3-hydroxybutyryl-CoA dehydrogenase
MDLTGIRVYESVMKDLFPDLSRSTEVPALMREIVQSGTRDIDNAKGFYRYTPVQAKAWRTRFLKFSYEIRALAERYPDHDGCRSRRLPGRRNGQ